VGAVSPSFIRELPSLFDIFHSALALSRRNSLGKCEPHLDVIYVSRPRRLSTSHDMRREHLRGVEVTDFARVWLAAELRAAASRAG
jgi:hypothetical protein